MDRSDKMEWGNGDWREDDVNSSLHNVKWGLLYMLEMRLLDKPGILVPCRHGETIG